MRGKESSSPELQASASILLSWFILFQYADGKLGKWKKEYRSDCGVDVLTGRLGRLPLPGEESRAQREDVLVPGARRRHSAASFSVKQRQRRKPVPEVAEEVEKAKTPPLFVVPAPAVA